MDQQIVKDVDVILGHRGFELVEEAPDLVVRYQAGRKEVFADDGTTYGGTSGYTYDEGRLKIDFIDPRKQEIVYEGRSEVMLSTDVRAKPEQVKKAILDALDTELDWIFKSGDLKRYEKLHDLKIRIMNQGETP